MVSKMGDQQRRDILSEQLELAEMLVASEDQNDKICFCARVQLVAYLARLIGE